MSDVALFLAFHFGRLAAKVWFFPTRVLLFFELVRKPDDGGAP
jgi:hypothetical protein